MYFPNGDFHFNAWHALLLVQFLGMGLTTWMLWHLIENAVGYMRPAPERGFRPTVADYLLGVLFLIVTLVLMVVWPLGLFLRFWAGGSAE